MRRLALVAAVVVISACTANDADNNADTTTQVAPAPAPAPRLPRREGRPAARRRASGRTVRLRAGAPWK